MAGQAKKRNQMPVTAKRGYAPPSPEPGNMAEKHVDAAQRAQAMEFLQKIMMAKGQGYTPIVKALNQIGVEFKTLDVTLDGESVECLVIPVADLMAKEWRYMSEMETIQENLG